MWLGKPAVSLNKNKKKVVWISDETLIVLKTLNLHELHKLFFLDY